MSVATSVVPAKNSTCATLPSASEADAVSVTSAGAWNVAPSEGDVSVTAGGTLDWEGFSVVLTV